MNKVILSKIEISENTIKFGYKIDGEWKKYFNKHNEYKIEYTETIKETPLSIACIPFVVNILPMTWIFDAELVLDEIDEGFYRSIKEFKEGYKRMYPMIKFNGKLTYNKLIDNSYNVTDKVAAFYSGGLDASSTVVTHYDERPMLMNLQGSDIDLRYTKVLRDVKDALTSVATNLELDIVFIKSEFRALINEKKINKYIKPIAKDNYWHGFQHGIAIIGHAAPLAYKYKMRNVYIASSFTKGDKASCASDPTIDNFVKLCSTNVVHDGYEFNRNDKSDNIGKFINKTNKKIKLRVCLDDYRVDNCCNCEKCYRTIFGFVSKGYDPKIVGFDVDDKFYKKVENDFKYKTIVQYVLLWENIQNEFLKHPELKKDQRFYWVYNFNFEKSNKKLLKYVLKIYNAILKRIKKVIRIIRKKGM